MINAIISFSIRQRLFVLVAALLLVVYGTVVISKMPVDVFPDLNRPTVTIMTEAHGLAPEEVESLVTLPVETLLNGATGVQRVRSVSGIGLSIVYVEFAWGTDIYIDRQIVNEKLQLAQSRLPKGMIPMMAPISSLMGEIMLIGMSSTTGETAPIELRSLADWVLRPRILAVPGVAQVTSIGGGVKQYQVLADPRKLNQFQVSLEEFEKAVASSNLNTSGGFLEASSREYIIRNIGRVTTLRDLRETVVAVRDGVPIRVGNLARVRFGPQVKRGDGSANASPAVILAVQKQPGASTTELTKNIQHALDEVEGSLPRDVVIHRDLFKQANFIHQAIGNVEEALRDGGIMVVVVLFLFLLNFRTTVITLTAIPLSFIISILIMREMGMTINTMTLGGLAVAIGELVDDAIVGVENVFRRLRENQALPHPRNSLFVIYEASSEIRNSIVYATLIIVVVFLPLLFFGGIEGRMFKPLGLAYIFSLGASLVVSLTVTPALCSYLLPKAKIIERTEDSPVVAFLKNLDRKLLSFTLKHPWHILAGALLLFLFSLSLFPLMGREFLPPFNEGTMTVNVIADPGTSLSESNRIGTVAERLLLSIPEVASTGRRTGRAEQDEHAEGVHYSEIDVLLKASRRSKEEILAEMRQKLALLPGVSINLGQPISHRLDHILSGVRAQIAVKLFGSDLATLRKKAKEIEEVVGTVNGVVDLSVEQQVLIPQVKVRVKREEAAKYGLQAAQVSEAMELALNGEAVSQVLEGQKTFDIFVRFDDPFRNRLSLIQETLIDTPTGARIPIRTVADVQETVGPNQVLHENVQRRIVISCNTQGRDLGSVVHEIQRKVKEQVAFPPGYFVTYGGQFESQEQATKLILFLSIISIAMIFLVLANHFNLSRVAIQIMSNLPLATIGGVAAVFLSGGTLSVASLVGFITVFGIASRNGIMMISHYLHLMKHEGEVFDEKMIVRGSLERLVPVLMTALTAGLALIPLVLAKGAAGKEILYPLAIVIFGGLLSSTLLDMAVTPALFYKFGRPAWELIQRGGMKEM